MVAVKKPVGTVTRGTTNPNRLRRVDRYIAALPVIRRNDRPVVVDLGFGASPITAVELLSRLARVNPNTHVVGIEIERDMDDEGVSFTALFTRTVQAVDGISAVDLSDEQSSMFKSLSGTYVLTISPSLQIRADVRDALREIGISSDSVVDFHQAREAVKSRMPNLIVVDSEIKDDAFESFRHDLLREVFEFPFVEISPDDSSFDMSGFGEFSMAKVGRGNIREALGTAVMFELAKMM